MQKIRTAHEKNCRRQPICKETFKNVEKGKNLLKMGWDSIIMYPLPIRRNEV